MLHACAHRPNGKIEFVLDVVRPEGATVADVHSDVAGLLQGGGGGGAANKQTKSSDLGIDLGQTNEVGTSA